MVIGKTISTNEIQIAPAGRARILPFSIFPVLFLLVAGHSFSAEPRPARWEKEIQAFEVQDRLSPPPRNPILFLGSASIGLYNVEKSFPNLPVLNRGFGGAELTDLIFYADRLIFPYKPTTIVLSVGEAEIAGSSYANADDNETGKTPEQVLEDFETFVEVIHEQLPRTEIIFIGIRPSSAHGRFLAKFRETNLLIKDFGLHWYNSAAIQNEQKKLDEAAMNWCLRGPWRETLLGFNFGVWGNNDQIRYECSRLLRVGRELFSYVDVDTPMWDLNDELHQELFARDGLYLNLEGYRLWTYCLNRFLYPPPPQLLPIALGCGTKSPSEAEARIHFSSWNRISVRNLVARSNQTSLTGGSENVTAILKNIPERYKGYGRLACVELEWPVEYWSSEFMRGNSKGIDQRALYREFESIVKNAGYQGVSFDQAILVGGYR